MDRLTEDKKEQISYDMLCQTHPLEVTVINEIASILVEVASGTQETYSINNTPLPAALVQSRLEELDHGTLSMYLSAWGIPQLESQTLGHISQGKSNLTLESWRTERKMLSTLNPISFLLHFQNEGFNVDRIFSYHQPHRRPPLRLF